jgi:tetratricopeptide (TPR) repeat protein
MTYASQGHYQHALDHLLQALELSETAGDRFWRARLLNTIGWVYRELFDVERAIRYDQASLELARAGTPRLTEAEGNALANLATDYLLQKDYSQMRFFLEEGLRGSGEKPFMRWRYHTRLLILKGRLALAEANAPGALAAADEALAITQGRQAPKNLARAYRLRGEALLASSQMNEARAALHQALEVGLQLKCPALIWPCQLNLARLEEANDHPETAQRHYAAAAAVIDQVVANLNEPKLRQTFLAAPPIQLIRANTGVEFLT